MTDIAAILKELDGLEVRATPILRGKTYEEPSVEQVRADALLMRALRNHARLLIDTMRGQRERIDDLHTACEQKQECIDGAKDLFLKLERNRAIANEIIQDPWLQAAITNAQEKRVTSLWNSLKKALKEVE